MSMKYMTVAETSKKWGISERRVRFLCSQGRIRGIIQQGRRYLIPDGTEKPEDERTRHAKGSRSVHYNDFTRLDFLKGLMAESETSDPLPENEMENGFDSAFAVSSLRLEGNRVTEEDMAQILENKVVDHLSFSEHLDIAGQMDAWAYAVESARDKKPLSQNTIRSIHSLALTKNAGEKGKYRRVKVRISGGSSSPVLIDLMEPRVNDLLNINTQRKKVMHPIERISRLYLEFMGIHPFSEGNGVVGRILMNMEFIQNGYPPILFVQSDQKKYTAAMNAFIHKQRPNEMIRLISRKMEEALENRLSDSEMKASKANLKNRH